MPRALRDRAGTAWHDSRMVARSLAGIRPPYRIPPSGQRTATRDPMPRPSLREVDVTRVERSAADAVTAWLAPRGEPLSFTPGQFLTLRVDIAGVEHRRAYSISNLPGDPDGIRVTVKRVPGGVVSNALNDTLAPGQRLSFYGPSGSFGDRLAAAEDVAFVAGGSGITPVMALLLSRLGAASAAPIPVLYGSHSPAHIIYRGHLARLAASHGARLDVTHLLAEGAEAVEQAQAGRMTIGAISAWITAIAPHRRARITWFICGPEAVLDHARQALAGAGVVADRIVEERFATAHAVAMAAPTTRQEVRAVVAGATHRFAVAPGETLLEGGLRAGVPMPYSCAVGGCGACRLRLISGEVVLDEPHCLTQRERDDGYTLTCIGRPLSAVEVRA